jgi:hypothetical protein
MRLCAWSCLEQTSVALIAAARCFRAAPRRSTAKLLLADEPPFAVLKLICPLLEQLGYVPCRSAFQ